MSGHGTTSPTAPDAAAAGPPATTGPRRVVRADLRLLGLLAGAWLTILLALRLRPGAAVLLGVGAGMLAVLLGLAARFTRGPGDGSAPGAGWYRVLGLVARILLPVLLGAGSGALATAARSQVRYGEPLARLTAAGALVQADLVLSGDPQPIQRFAFAPPSWLVDATMERFRPLAADGGAVRLRAPVIVFGTVDRWRSLLPGQRVTVTAELARPERSDLTAAVLSVRADPRLIGHPPWYQRAAGRLRAGLRRACQGLPAGPAGLLPGLVDGDTSALDPVIQKDFTAAGMTHLTAVSGSNLAIVLAFVLLLARWGRAGPRIAAAAGLTATIAFVILVRPDPSVLRAALMGGFGLLAMALHRPRAAVPGLAAASAVLLLADPSLAVQLGFALSVLATLGLLLFAPAWRDALRRRRVPAGVAEVLAVSLAAHIACAPVIAGWTGTVGLATVPANVLAEPAVAPATVLGVGAAVLSPVTPAGAHLLAWLAAWPCRWLVLVARYAAQAPAAVLSWPAGVAGGALLAVLILVFVALVGHPRARRLTLVAALAALLVAVPVRWVGGGWPPGNWVFTACDVGQGDGLALNAAPGQAVVVDTGPEPTAIDRCLRALNVRSVPLLVLTHDDADHISGISGVFDSRRVGAVAISRYDPHSNGRRQVVRVAAAHGLTPFPAKPGWVYRAGALSITVIGTPQLLTGTESDTNNNCVVLRVVSRGVSVLLTGDAGPEEQAALRHAGVSLRSAVLKVPHHGSVHQDPGFVSAVAPRVAVISVGADNDYGQPGPALVRRLQAAGIRVLRTDRDGDVAIVATDSGLAVARHSAGPGPAP